MRAHVVCDEWEQASHNGDISHALEARKLHREQVAELGKILLGEQIGRRDEHEITVFDSTGLAVQDLAVAVAVFTRYREAPASFPDVVGVELG